MTHCIQLMLTNSLWKEIPYTNVSSRLRNNSQPVFLLQKSTVIRCRKTFLKEETDPLAWYVPEKSI